MLQISHQQFQELITSRPVVQTEELGYDLYHTTYESSIDDPICKGTSRSILIREGMTLIKAELNFQQDTEIEMKSTHPQVGFGFFLKGSSVAYIKELNNKPVDFSLPLSQRSTFTYANASSAGPQQFFSNQTFLALYIHFNYASFKEFMGESIYDLPKELLNALNNNDAAYFQTCVMSKELFSLCSSVLGNPFNGKSREFYTEAKVIELMAYQIDALLKTDKEDVTLMPSLSEEEVKKIDFCYAQLQKDLSHPPSVIELARSSGLSVYRLKNGLRVRYGHSFFRLLTEMRMLKAKELLEHGGHNVSEVAMEVGYSSLGTFSNAFVEKFGRRPSSFMKPI